jgi:hypothetical protein
MTSPASLRYKGKIQGSADEDCRWIRRALIIVFAGGIIGGIAVYFAHQKELAFGIVAGSGLSALNFHFLYGLSAKILRAGQRGKKVFWLWTSVRWFMFALIGWGLIQISPACLWGALGGYFWGLAVLTWSGWQTARFSAHS